MVGIYFALLPRIINVEKYEPQIRNTLEKSLENPILFGHMNSKLTWNMRLKINVDKLSVYYKDYSCFASSGPASFELSLPHLLIHKIKIKKIELKNPYFIIKRLENGHFDFERLCSGKEKVAIFDNTEIIAQDYKIYFIDDFLPQRQSFLFTGKKLQISDFDPNEAIKVDVSGSFSNNKKPQTNFNIEYSSKLPLNRKDITKNNLLLKGQLENIYSSTYLPNLQKYFPDYSSLSGVINSDFNINLHESDFWNDKFKFDIYVQNFIAKKHSKGEVLKSIGNLNIEIFAKSKKHKLLLEKFTIKAPCINIILNGEIEAFDSKNPKWDLKLFVKNTKIEGISYLFPEEIKVPYDIFEYVKKFKVKSNTSGSVDIKGIGKNLDLFGSLKFTGFSITRNSQKISDGIIKVKFKGKTNYIDADVWSKPDEHLYVKGTIIPQSNKISLGVKAQGIELGPFLQLLFAIRDIMKFNLGHFINNTTIYGKGDSDIYVYGDPSNHYLYGYLKFSDCKLDYSGLSQPFEHVIGKVKFHEDDIYYNNIKAVNLKSPMIINGKVVSNKKADLIIDSPKLNAIETRKLINESRDLLTTKKSIKDMKAISGYFVAKLVFGHDKKSDFMFKKLTLNAFKDCSVTYGEIGFPIKILKGSIIITDKGTFLKDIQAEAFGITAKVSGEIIHGQNRVIQNYIVNFKNFPAEKIHEFEISPLMSDGVKNIFQKFQNSRGYLDADLKFHSNKVFADVRFHDTDFLYLPLNLPTRVKNGRLLINPKNIKFEAFNANIDNYPIYLDGSINNYQSVPLFDNFIVAIPESTNSRVLKTILTKKMPNQELEGGSFGGKIIFHGPISSLNFSGGLEFNNIRIGEVIINHAFLNSSSGKINLHSADIDVAGQNFEISAIAENNLKIPFKINQLQISAKKLNLNCFTDSVKKTWSNSNQTTLPLIIENGSICINEIIWKNFVATNFYSSLNLDETNRISLPAFKFHSANGVARGCVSYNIENTQLAGCFSIKNMSIGSLAYLFKMPPKDVSGCLNCNGRFCTYGKSKSQIKNNTKAEINFKIKDGYLKKLGKAEYLLTAQSTFMSGITNITINQILELIFPQNLGSFQNFSGTIIADKGSLMSNNLCLKSKNLGVLASSNFQLNQKKIDIIALGQLPKENRKKLGFLGEISASSVLGFIPGLNFMPGNTKLIGLIGILPFFNKTSFFNGSCPKKSPSKYKKFVARMIKLNNCKKTIGSLEWFDKLSEMEKTHFCFEK